MEKIKQKITKLKEEAVNLVNIEEQLQQQLNEIQTRLIQIVGAIKALDGVLEDSIIKKEKNDES